jgi:hypothetical protein
MDLKFKRWLENQDLTAADINARPTTAAGPDDDPQIKDDILNRVYRLMSSLDPKQKDSHYGTRDRAGDGTVQMRTSGTPSYMSPEMAKSAFNPQRESWDDLITNLMSSAGSALPHVEQNAKAIMNQWVQFRNALYSYRDWNEPLGNRLMEIFGLFGKGKESQRERLAKIWGNQKEPVKTNGPQPVLYQIISQNYQKYEPTLKEIAQVLSKVGSGHPQEVQRIAQLYRTFYQGYAQLMPGVFQMVQKMWQHHQQGQFWG